MRRILGLLVLLYGLLLALNTAAPSLAEVAGDKVTARLNGATAACTDPIGSPPFGGLYGNCPALWPGSEGGRLFGAKVGDRLAVEEEISANTYPLLDDYAVLPPSTSDQVAAIISLLIILLGIMLLVSERTQARRGSGHDNDADTDTDSDDSDSVYSSDGNGGASGSNGGGD